MRILVRLTLFCLFLTPFTFADSFAVDPSLLYSNYQINFYAPGQSFTAAGGRLVSFGFYIVDMNPFAAPNDYTISAKLLAGDGLSGPVLATADALLAPNGRLYRWVDFQFGNVELAPDLVYTVQLADDSIRWGITIVAPNANPYSGGHVYFKADDIAPYTSDTQADAIFRMTTTTVPEPTALALFASGIVGLGASRRFRSHAAKEVVE